MELTPKSIPFEAFDEIHQVAIDIISENMAPLVQPGMYGAINTADNTSNLLYVIQLISEAYMLQKTVTIYGKVISAHELVVRAQYLCSLQENTNIYWKQQPLQQTIIVPTQTIIHPHLHIIIIRYLKYIPNNLCSRNQAKKSIQRHPIIMTDADYDYILD